MLNNESQIKLTANQEIELDKRLDAFMTDHDIGSPWSDVKGRIISNK